MSKEKETEQKIFDAARSEFYSNGYAGARMQDIADKAGINKSMLHYYYRSKDRLFQAVFQEGVRNFFPVILEVLASDLGLVPKIEKLVEVYHEHLLANPHLPSFVIHEMNQHPDRFREFVLNEQIRFPPVFKRQVEAEIDAGAMTPIEPHELLINVIGLCVFPFMARTMIQSVFGMDEDRYRGFIQKRKAHLADFILNAVKK